MSLSSLHASPFDQFLMPGKLIEGHQKTEKNCESCHEAFDQQEQDGLCRACHKKIDSDIVENRGFHGVAGQVENNTCKFCHTDHVGRDADIVALDVHTFDHDQSDFKLKGRHQKVICETCHKKNEKYREAKHECIACHERSDVHKKRMGEKCHDCHAENDWRKTKFDHDDTGYKLTGGHGKISCGACHPNQLYKDTPRTCIACHKIQDIHQHELDTKCSQCHKTSLWKDIKFDHDKTKFKLRNSHAKIRCNACHKTNDYKKEIKRSCVSCHSPDDKHSGLFGEKCQSCHVDEDWKKLKFDHDEETTFALKGDHKKTKCNSCHLGHLYKNKIEKSCKNCHEVDDVHNAKQKQDCGYCHQQSGWQKKLLFDHDFTDFPLIGLHNVVACESCHMTFEYQLERYDCFSCHKNEDVHNKTLTDDCVLCHNPNDWGIWEFDHDKQSDYPLTGAHKKINCEACHQQPVVNRKKIVLSDKCISCHQQDDVHAEQFGKYCSRCHSTESFGESDLID